jgi:hypothetical protein
MKPIYKILSNVAPQRVMIATGYQANRLMDLNTLPTLAPSNLAIGEPVWAF